MKNASKLCVWCNIVATTNKFIALGIHYICKGELLMTIREMLNNLKVDDRDLMIANSNLSAKVNILEEKLKIAEDYIDKYKELVNQQNDAIDKLDARLKEILNGNNQ